MSTEYWCPPHIYLAAVDDDVIALDLVKDLYFCLVEATHAIQPQSDGRVHLGIGGLDKDLLQAGIISHRPLERRRPTLVKPQREATPSKTAPLGEVIRAGIALARAHAIFQGQSFPSLIRCRLPRSVRTRTAELGDLLAAARQARPWIPFEGECLKRSFLLRRFLASNGVDTDWVFGVRTWPFAAHCWLQLGDVVVGDRLERVNRFTPIMRVQS